eukprot:355512-Chlamydomonas_euryale.AAC.3
MTRCTELATRPSSRTSQWSRLPSGQAPTCNFPHRYRKPGVETAQQQHTTQHFPPGPHMASPPEPAWPARHNPPGQPSTTRLASPPQPSPYPVYTSSFSREPRKCGTPLPTLPRHKCVEGGAVPPKLPPAVHTSLSRATNVWGSVACVASSSTAKANGRPAMRGSPDPTHVAATQRTEESASDAASASSCTCGCRGVGCGVWGVG